MDKFNTNESKNKNFRKKGEVGTTDWKTFGKLPVAIHFPLWTQDL